MHLVGYRTSSCTAQELVIEGRNYVAAAAAWVISLTIGLGGSGFCFWTATHPDAPGSSLDTGATTVLYAMGLAFLVFLLLPFTFVGGPIVRRTIRLSRDQDQVAIAEYTASGRQRSSTVALGRPSDLYLKTFKSHPLGGAGPWSPIQILGLQYGPDDIHRLTGLSTPTLRAESSQSRSIIAALRQWLGLPETP